MHSYSKAFNYTPYVHALLAAFAVGAYFWMSTWPLPSVIPISPLIAFTIFGAMEALFEWYLWHALTWIPALRVINLNGAYAGTLRTNGQQFDVTVAIKQRWSQMSIRFDSSGTGSRSIAASFVKDGLGADQVELIYQYSVESEFDGGGEEVVPPHYGTCMLRISKDQERLEGQYFTTRKRAGLIGLTSITPSAKTKRSGED